MICYIALNLNLKLGDTISPIIAIATEKCIMWGRNMIFWGVLTPLSEIFHLHHAINFNGGRSRSIRTEPQTMGKQLVNIIMVSNAHNYM